MKRLIASLLVALILSNCGGGSDGDPVTFSYRGKLSGTGCFSFQPLSSMVDYTVIIDDLSVGNDVQLIDEHGDSWYGSMTSDSSLLVTLPDGDERLSITMNEVSANSANVEATTTCVSFRCCETLTGEVTG